MSYISVLHFFFIAEWYFIVWVYNHLFMHSPINGHFSCFQVWVIAKKASMNVCAQASAWIYASFEQILKSEVAGLYGGYTLTLSRNERIIFQSSTWPRRVSPSFSRSSPSMVRLFNLSHFD